MSLYVGIDVSKVSHVAALLTRDLLVPARSAGRLPTLKIDNSRAGFEQLLDAITLYSDLADTSVLLERTGHYGTNLEQFLQEHGVQVYRLAHAQRYANNKSDALDARALAILLYNQEALHIEHVDEQQRIALLIPPSEVARHLRALVQHRYELAREQVRRQNKLTAIADELFPEFTLVYSDPNGKSALNIRTAFPTPQAVAAASIAELRAQRPYLSQSELIRLQELAAGSIGSRDAPRVQSLCIEQRQLIAELRLMRTHTAELDVLIETAIADSREGRILQSFPGIGAVNAATLLAGIGTIANFDTENRLRSYLGWSARRSQTGTTYDMVALSRGGNVMMKRTMLLVAFSAIAHDPDWQAEYDGLVARMCALDKRTLKPVGRMKAIGHICGRLITSIYALLKRDYDLVQRTPPGTPLPEPELYDGRKRHGRALHEREETHAVHAPVLATETTRPLGESGR